MYNMYNIYVSYIGICKQTTGFGRLIPTVCHDPLLPPNPILLSSSERSPECIINYVFAWTSLLKEVEMQDAHGPKPRLDRAKPPFSPITAEKENYY
jgi:hypothetical protein